MKGYNILRQSPHDPNSELLSVPISPHFISKVVLHRRIGAMLEPSPVPMASPNKVPQSTNPKGHPNGGGMKTSQTYTTCWGWDPTDSRNTGKPQGVGTGANVQRCARREGGTPMGRKGITCTTGPATTYSPRLREEPGGEYPLGSRSTDRIRKRYHTVSVHAISPR